MNKLKKLQKARLEFERDNRLQLDLHHLTGSPGDPPEVQLESWDYERAVKIAESEKLRDLALKWNIDIQTDWIMMVYDKEGEFVTHLSDKGLAFLRETITKKRRENTEWWITKVVAPIAGIIIALLGAILAFLKLKP